MHQLDDLASSMAESRNSLRRTTFTTLLLTTETYLTVKFVVGKLVAVDGQVEPHIKSRII